MKAEKNSLKNKHILVTGCTGFLGKIVTPLLLSYGAKVSCIGRNKPDLDVNFYKADLTIDSLPKHIFYNVDFVLHIGGFVPKNKKEDDFYKNYLNNTIATINLFQSTNNIPFFYVSTCEVYGFQEKIPITEDVVPKPVSNYAISKYLAEFLLFRSSNITKRNLSILRLTTIYGKDDPIERAIPNFINKALRNEDIEIFGDGSDKRDYLYVEDAANAIVKALLHQSYGIYNVSSAKELSIKNLANLVISLTNSKSKIKYYNTNNKRDLIFSNSKTTKFIKFRPKIKIEQGLKKIIK